MRHTPHISQVLGCTLLVAALGAGLSACGSDDPASLSHEPFDAADQLSFAGPTGEQADADRPLEITAADGGRITDVVATDADGRRVAGSLTDDGRVWRSSTALAPESRYKVRVRTENGDGEPGTKVHSFQTGKVDKSRKRLKVDFGPDSGRYGVGQPVTAELSAPVKDKRTRALVERALKVDTSPSVQGSWYWVDSKTLHYRPRSYWPANATVNVHSELAGVRIDDKLWGGRSKGVKLTTGDRVEAVTDAGTHQMTVLRNGREIRTVPVTTGKPGFDTRNGVKVVLAKESFVRMRSSTVGIAEGSSESYDLPVHWATRVTQSGEYVHAAPWSVGSQGVANVSHGCTGLSTENAEWFFNTVREGDIVKVVNSGGETMTPFDNGYGDWNLSWAKWQKGSALNPGGGQGDAAEREDGTRRTAASRLQPEL